MDIIIPIIIIILLFITCSVCGYCCKRNKQGIVYGIASPPVTTTTATTYNTGNAPYPIMETPMPQPVAAVPGFAPHVAYPPTTPYPPAQGYPPPAAAYPGNAPYPTMPMPSGAYTSPVPSYPASATTHQLPPSYAEATQQGITNEVYHKQAPYNPNYN